jgi:hypothetical protein
MQLKTRYIPKDSIPVYHPEGLGIAYVYRIKDGAAYGVIAYGGKRNNADFHYSYRSIDAAHEKIEQWFGGLESHREYIAKSRQERQKPHTFVVGDIVSNSWGYDQTNVDFYRVTRISPSYVWLQPIGGNCDQNGFMSGRTVADPSHDLNKPVEMHRATGNYVSMKFGSGSKWDGKPLYESWYA